MDSKHTINYTTEDLVEYYTNKLAWQWLQQNHPDLIDKIKLAVEQAIKSDL